MNKERLLLHACCADCALKILKKLSKKYEVEIYYYNPNIHPRSEYLTRLKAMQQVAERMDVKIIVADYTPKDYFEAIQEEGESRCVKCYRLRMGKTFEFAKSKGYKTVTTTLLSSNYMDEEKVVTVGKMLEKGSEVKFVRPKGIDKDENNTGFYKQIYCGCCFSLTERLVEKYKKT